MHSILGLALWETRISTQRVVGSHGALHLNQVIILWVLPSVARECHPESVALRVLPGVQRKDLSRVKRIWGSGPEAMHLRAMENSRQNNNVTQVVTNYLTVRLRPNET